MVCDHLVVPPMVSFAGVSNLGHWRVHLVGIGVLKYIHQSVVLEASSVVSMPASCRGDHLNIQK